MGTEALRMNTTVQVHIWEETDLDVVQYNQRATRLPISDSQVQMGD